MLGEGRKETMENTKGSVFIAQKEQNLVRSWGTPLPVYCPLLDPFVKPQDKQ
jgi:hypothetical protein